MYFCAQLPMRWVICPLRRNQVPMVWLRSDSLRVRAAEMNFVEGARYSEAAAGTNGIGTVLAADRALLHPNVRFTNRWNPE